MSIKIRQNGVWVDVADSNVANPTTNLTASGANYETVTTTLSGNNVVEVSGFPSYTNRIVSTLNGSAVNGTSVGYKVGHVIEFKTASGYWSDNNPGTYTGGGPYSVLVDYQTYNYAASNYSYGVSVFGGVADWNNNLGGTSPWFYTHGTNEVNGAVLKVSHVLVFERIPGSNSWTINGGSFNYQNTTSGVVWNNTIQGTMEFSEPVTGYRLILCDLGTNNLTKTPVHSWTAGNLKTTYEGDGTVNVAESNDVGQGFFVNDTTLTTDTILPTGKNVGIFGPYSIASGTTLTVPTGTTFSVV